jgi:hypothetical protein
MKKTFRNFRWAITLASLSVTTVFSQVNPDYQFILIADTGFVLARTNNKELTDGRYVIADVKTVLTINPKVSRATSVIFYSFDCQEPKKVALIESWFNLETSPNAEPRWGQRREDGVSDMFHPRDLKYVSLGEFNETRFNGIKKISGKQTPSSWPEETNVAGEYACRTAKNPETAKKVAADIEKTGGVADLKELICALSFVGRKESNGIIKFSEDQNFVQVNGKWKLGAFVNDQHIGFSDKTTETRISRATGKLIMTDKESSSVFASGTCEVAGVKKF